MSVYFYADDLEREKKLPYLFQVILSYCVRYGEAYATSSKLEGIAAWLSSDNHPMTFWRLVRSGMLTAMLKSGGAGTARVRNLADCTETVHKRLAPCKHWYLQMLGINPQFQGRGYASRLLLPMLSRLDEQGLSCYLETMEESNIPMYQHFGFRVLEQSQIPDTKITFWVMLRDNQ
jgi:ribosomal protein S18 acetylase RimI-like enzyme